MTRLPIALLACLALAGGAVAGCGSGDDDATSTPAAAPPPPPQASSAASGDELRITMKNIEYVPAQATAKVDQKIVWENTDGQIPHTVTATDGADFDSGTMKPGDTFEFTPTKAGTISYVCEIHPNQKGTIEVSG
jgi:plastocyanin